MADTFICGTWNIRNKTWSDLENLTWSDLGVICTVLDNFVGLDGASSNEIKRSTLKKKIKILKENEKSTFIKIFCKIKDKEKTESHKINKKIILSVEDMEFIINEITDIKVTFL